MTSPAADHPGAPVTTVTHDRDAGSTNPIVNYHVIYALSLIVIAVLSAGDTWGAGRAWKRLGIVQKAPWLI